MSVPSRRREFLRSAAQALAASTLAGCASLPSSPRQSAPAAVVDTHTHFYDPTRPQGVPWPPREESLLYRPVYPRDYRAVRVPRPVTATVVVEASPWLEDNQWILDLAASDPFIVGFVGNLPVGATQFPEHLKRFAGNPAFRGIRIGSRKSADLADDSIVLRHLHLLAERGLSLDLLGGPEILAFASALSRKIPSLRIVIDHLAGLRIDGDPPPRDWLDQMAALAPRSSIYFKLSGLVEGTGRADGSAPRDAQFYAPALDAMMKLFGPSRLLYASNWPVSERFAPLAVTQGVVDDYLRSAGNSAREEVFSLTSKRAYQWQARAAI